MAQIDANQEVDKQESRFKLGMKICFSAVGKGGELNTTVSHASEFEPTGHEKIFVVATTFKFAMIKYIEYFAAAGTYVLVLEPKDGETEARKIIGFLEIIE